MARFLVRMLHAAIRLAALRVLPGQYRDPFAYGVIASCDTVTRLHGDRPLPHFLEQLILLSANRSERRLTARAVRYVASEAPVGYFRLSAKICASRKLLSCNA